MFVFVFCCLGPFRGFLRIPVPELLRAATPEEAKDARDLGHAQQPEHDHGAHLGGAPDGGGKICISVKSPRSCWKGTILQSLFVRPKIGPTGPFGAKIGRAGAAIYKSRQSKKQKL